MKIRSITYFTPATHPLEDATLTTAGRFLEQARAAYIEAGYEVQTVRLALPPFALLVGNQPNDAVALAQALEAACFVHGIDYATIGPARLGDSSAHFQIIPAVLRATDTIFTAAEIATPAHGLSLSAIKLVADIIRQLSTLSPDGIGNLRFAALANVPAGVPFLPAAYHDPSQPPAFALALQSADLAVNAFTQASSLTEARVNLQTTLEQEADKLSRIANRLGGNFKGLDFSFAPFPADSDSIGAALESLGIAHLGQHGSLAAAAIVTETLQQARLPHVGFSGLFLPLLEDSRLAQRGAEGHLTLNDLLLYSAVCGTGLDTIPLPGDTPPEDLAAILLDVGALALRLNKPLTARLMPMPNKHAGDELTFDFPYFANSRVLGYRASPLTGLLAGVENFPIAPRKS